MFQEPPLRNSGSATGTLKVCLHVPSPCPCPSPSLCPSKFIIVSMEMDRLMDRMGSVPILPVKWTVTIGTMLNFDGDGHGDGTCKQTLMTGVGNESGYSLLRTLICQRCLNF